MKVTEFPPGCLVILLDDISAQAAAKKAGVFTKLLTAPPGTNKLATVIGAHFDGHVLAARWYGFTDTAENGWAAVMSTDRALLRTIARELHEFGRGALIRRKASNAQPLINREG